MSLSEQALSIAISQIGVKEVGTNSGPEVNEYLRSVGLGSGYPWCMAFVYWCYNEAAKKMGVKNPLIRTGGVLHQWNEQQPTRKIILDRVLKNPGLAKPGSVFIMDFGGGAGHTGLIERAYGGYVDTVEGNTNTAGSREGVAVLRKTRKLISLKGILIF